MCGDILNGLLHVLTKVVDPGGLATQANMWSCVRGRVSQANCRDIGGKYREFKRIGSGYKISINDGGHRRATHIKGTYQYQCQVVPCKEGWRAREWEGNGAERRGDRDGAVRVRQGADVRVHQPCM